MDASQKAAGENTKLSYRQPSIPDITRDRMADVLAKQLKRVVDTRENQHETFRKKNLEVLSEPNEVVSHCSDP
jgi:hypothetical protein